MMPALVVPAVATTAHTVSSSSRPSMPARIASPVSTPSMVSTTTADIIVMLSAFVIDECACSLTTTRKGTSGSPASARRRRIVSRATTSADRLPAEPPETNTPPAVGGSPAMSAMRAEHLVLGHHRAGGLEPRDPLQ